MKLSPHFSREEFACKGKDCCGHSAVVHPDLIKTLQALRDRIGKPLSILSGFRCRTHNKRVGGAPGSYHTLGMAADIRPPKGMTPAELAAEATMIDLFAQGGIGIYDAWVHLDIRTNGPARWDHRTDKNTSTKEIGYV